MSARVERGRVVHAVAGHRHDVPLLLQDADEADLVLGRDAGDHTDVIDLGEELLVGHRGELGSGERSAFDAQLLRDGRRRRRVVARDHADPNARVVAERDRVLRLLAGRVDDADQGDELEIGHEGKQIARGIKRAGIEVAPCHREHSEPLSGEPIVLRQHTFAMFVRHGGGGPVGRHVPSRPGEQHIGGALDEAAHHRGAVVVHLVEGGHQLVLGVERHFRDAGVEAPGLVDVDAALGRQDDERAFGRVPDARPITNHCVVGQGHRQHEGLE